MKNLISVFIIVFFISFVLGVLEASFKESLKISIFPAELCKSKGLDLDKTSQCIRAGNILFSLKKSSLKSLVMHPKKIIEGILEKDKVNLSSKGMHGKQHWMRMDDYNPILTFSSVEIFEGDKCLVSGLVLVPGEDVVVEIKGRRLPFKKEAVHIFLENPGKYFALKQAKGAFISENMTSDAPVSLAYFIIGLYLIIALIIGGICSSLALNKGLKASHWFAFGFLFNVIALILILLKKDEDEAVDIGMLGRIKKTKQPIRCANCGYENHPDANSCAKCNAVFVK